MISDLVKEEQKTKSNGGYGFFNRFGFAISMIAGPTIGAAFGVQSLFYLTLILALVLIFVLLKFVPNPPHITHRCIVRKQK